MAESIICGRSFEFACRILKLGERIPSIGANAEEAQDAQTKADYCAKMAISRKEARETRYWLTAATRYSEAA